MSARTFLAVLALFAAACDTPTPPTLSIVSTGSPPVGGIGNPTSAPIGVVIGFSVDSTTSSPPSVSIDDPSRASIFPTATGQYVLIGRARGQTTLRARADGVPSVALPVLVSDQP